MKFKLIHQWQYPGQIDGALLGERAFQNALSLGVTSLQSYVPWSEIERKPGVFSYESYTPLLKVLRERGLKWTPFIIIGPGYSLPKWYSTSAESVKLRCNEHGIDSTSESIWNHSIYKYADIFFQNFSQTIPHDLIDEILIGVSGSWGESIFPVSGGFSPQGHVHHGHWCADKLAKISYENFIKNDRDFFDTGRNASFFSQVKMPGGIVRDLYNNSPSLIKKIIQEIFRKKSKRNKQVDKSNVIEISDFYNWYTQAMTDHSEQYVKMLKKLFPESIVTLVGGGNGSPYMGADFSKQIRMVARHNSKFRITNHMDSYNQSQSITKLVVTAAKFYGVELTTEEAGVNTEEGVDNRLFDAISNNITSLYFKGLIETGDSQCHVQSKFEIGDVTSAGLRFQKLSKQLLDKNIVPELNQLLVIYPKIDTYINPLYAKQFTYSLQKLRQYSDYDLADEVMLADGYLEKNNYKIILLMDINYLDDQSLRILSHFGKKVVCCNIGDQLKKVLETYQINYQQIKFISSICEALEITDISKLEIFTKTTSAGSVSLVRGMLEV